MTTPPTHTTPMRRTALLMLAFVGIAIVSVITVLLPEIGDEESQSDETVQPFDAELSEVPATYD